MSLPALVFALFSLLFSAAASAADCNGNGVEDREDIAGGTSLDCNRNDRPDECEKGLFEFGPAADRLSLLQTPLVLTAADFNGDGLPDLVSGIQNRNSPRARLSVFLSDPQGEAMAFGRARTTVLATGITSIVHGDVEGDGDLDLISVDDDTLSIFTNDGEGIFAHDRDIEIVGNLFGLVARDLNGDGSLDIAVSASRRDAVIVLLGQGGGDFADLVAYPVGDTPFGLASADLDGDGHLDLAVCNWRSNSLSVLWNDGEGGFAETTLLESGERRPRFLVAADLDRDGVADLAVANLRKVTFFLSRRNRSFEAPTAFEVSPRFLDAGDYDGDGDLDIVVGFASSNSLSVLINSDDGTFRGRVDLGVAATAVTSFSEDFNGDGAVDIAVGTDGPAQVSFLVNGEERRSLSMVTTRYSYGQPPHGAEMGDMDGDGDLDFVTGNGLRGTVSVLINDGEGRYRLTANFPGGGYLNTIDLADLDGDGDLDVITAHFQGSHVLILKNRGDGRLDRSVRYTAGRAPFMVLAGDIDGDGHIDVASANRGAGRVSVLWNVGDGTFEPPTQLRTGSNPRCVALGDFDEDGWVDLAAANEGSRNVVVFINGGDRSFGAPLRLPTVRPPFYVIAGDWNRDGHLDLATCLEASQQLGILLGNGDGTFAEQVTYSVGQSPFSVRQGDLDGDGLVDLVTANWREPQSSVSVMLGDGQGRFTAAARFRVRGVEPRWAPVGDVNGDGSADVVSADHDSDSLTVLLNQLPSPFTEPFLERICTEADFHDVSIRSRRRGAVDREGKYIVPAVPDEPGLLSPKFQNVKLYEFHEQFLRAVFDQFRNLGKNEYVDLTTRRATRKYYVGSIQRVRTEEGILYTFDVFIDLSHDLGELLSVEEVRSAYNTLREVFELPLAYRPRTEDDRRAAERWVKPGFPVFIDDGAVDFDYEPYTLAVGYGRARLLDEAAFNERNNSGRFTLQDLVVLDFAPQDIEGIVGGVITGRVQGNLSHVAIRTARRGTPNAFVANAHDVFREWEGQLVRLEVAEDGFTVDPATLKEAEAFWERLRPDIGELPPADLEYAGFDSLLEADLAGPVPPVSRYGGKAANFARLQRVLTGEFERYREAGFAIPMRYYREFLRSNTMPSLNDPARRVTYEVYLDELMTADEFLSDSTARFRLLGRLREVMEDAGVVPRGLVTELALRVDEVFGFTRSRVRFRSSSNVEDLLQFNGAGLYDSTSICAADDLDLDDQGPSICDRSRRNERGVARGLKRVWASLWTFRAFEERAFFRIPQEGANMGLLVSRAFTDEAANGVAFTGNPNDPTDKRYQITVQVGENSVVSPEPGQVPERDILSVVDGKVVRIRRDRSSNLVDPGRVVLSDETLRELGRVLWHIDQNFPLELEGFERDRVVLDLEFKLSDGALAIKQVRPFLIPVPKPPTPTFELVVPPGTAACSQLDIDSPLRDSMEMYESKSSVRFIEGPVELPTTRRSFQGELFEEVEVRFGRAREVATPIRPGLFEVIRGPRVRGVGSYQFDFQQDFALADGRTLTLRLGGLTYQARDEAPIVGTVTLTEEFITDELELKGDLDGDPAARYSSCTYELLPLWAVEADLEGGARLSYRVRFRESKSLAGTGPASVVRADVNLGGDARQSVTDYWRLVYSSRNHNLRPSHWALLDPPLTVAGLDRPVRVVEFLLPAELLGETFPEEARYLDENFEVIARPRVLSFRFEESDDLPPPSFRRGDVDANGSLNLSDAVRVLNYLFRGGPAPGCFQSADANDDGRVNITDGVVILRHLFQGGRPPAEPFAACGPDPTADTLSCGAFPACP